MLIREPQNMEAFQHKKGIATLIGALPILEIMRFAVDLDDQLVRQASEVGNVVAKRHLPTKAKTVNSIGLQVTP